MNRDYEDNPYEEDPRDFAPDPEWGYGPFWCEGCKLPCEVIEVDFGIGAYEYWGAPGFDVQICAVSNCCEDEFTEVDPTLVEPNDDEIDESEVA